MNKMKVYVVRGGYHDETPVLVEIFATKDDAELYGNELIERGWYDCYDVLEKELK